MSRPPAARFSRPKAPEPAAGPEPPTGPPKKSAAAPSIFPTGNARTATSPPEPAAVQINLAASRRTRST